jgi:hypothetical protein
LRQNMANADAWHALLDRLIAKGKLIFDTSGESALLLLDDRRIHSFILLGVKRAIGLLCERAFCQSIPKNERPKAQ